MPNNYSKILWGVAGAGMASVVFLTFPGDKEKVTPVVKKSPMERREKNRKKATSPTRGSEGASRVNRSQARLLEQFRLERDKRQSQLKKLRAQVEELGGNPDTQLDTKKGENENVKVCLKNGRSPGCSFFEPGQETLKEMARCGMIRTDYPSFLRDDREIEFPSEMLAEAGVSDAEKAQMIQAAASFRENSLTIAREMFLEAGGGSPELLEDMQLSALGTAIDELLDKQELETARRSVARERASLEDGPEQIGELSLAERWVRHNANMGNGLENSVASVIGPDRARDLRRVNNGWPGYSSEQSGKCKDEP